MKKLLAVLLTITMVFTLIACGNNNSGNEATSSTEGFELALITDLGTIDDGGFNQGSWEGLEKYAKENNISHKYYQPADQGDDAYLNAIDLAVQSGAKVIVCPGYLFETPLFVAQDRYPDTKFVLVDGTPNDGDWSSGMPASKIGDNLVAVHFAEEQAGFLAGYAAVSDGYRNLGFMGGMAVPAVIRFGHGFIQGAEAAAQDLGLAAGTVKINYHYTGTFAPAPEIQTMAAAWYNDGIEAIFVCGGGIVYSVVPAAEQAGTKIIGVDLDQADISETVITSAMKGLSVSVYDSLADYYAGKFPGGKEYMFSAANNGIGLPMASSRFNSFTQSDYDAVFGKLANGSTKVDNNIGIGPNDILTSAVSVNNLE